MENNIFEVTALQHQNPQNYTDRKFLAQIAKDAGISIL